MVRKLLLALVVPLLIVSACSDGDEAKVDTSGLAAGAQPIALIQQAPDRALELGSGRLEMTTTAVVDGTTYEVIATGAFTGTRARLEMDLGEVLTAGAAAGMLPEGADESVEIVVDGMTAYLRMPLLAGLTGVDGWLSMSAADFGQPGDPLGLGVGSTNPLQILEALRGVTSDVETLGESSDGKTYGYRITVDLMKAAEALPDRVREAYGDELGALGVTELPVEVWLDGDGLVRLLEVDLGDLTTGAEGLGGLQSGRLEVRFADYGADIDVDLPDPSEVTPFAEVMGSLGPRR